MFAGDNIPVSHEKRAVDVGKNIWTSMLSEVSSRNTTSRMLGAEKNIVILGNDLSGKTTLATKLQGNEDPQKGSALEYQFMEVHDDDADEKTVCGIWILEGHRSYRSLLGFALPKERLSDSIIIITVDMSQPWDIMDSLNIWTTVIREHIDLLKITADELHRLEKQVIEDFQNYIDPTESDEAGNASRLLKTGDSQNNSEDITMPLDDKTLTCNLGTRLVVVCTKCDHAEKLEKDYDYRDEHFDFIQFSLRTFCLKYGAALFYTSVKDNKNMDILQKYLLHKLYNLPFSAPASVVEKDAVFVPSGWDTDKKIGIVLENFTKVSPDDPYENVIVRPIVRKPLQEMKEISAEDEQSFLTKAQVMLTSPQSGPNQPRSSVPSRGTVDVNRMKGSQPTRATIGGLPGASAAKLKPDPTKPAPSNERVLANFFNSLLNKKPASTGSPGKGDKAAAELARLQQSSIKQRNSTSSSSKQSTESS